jgi:hypothetical protein
MQVKKILLAFVIMLTIVSIANAVEYNATINSVLDIPDSSLTFQPIHRVIIEFTQDNITIIELTRHTSETCDNYYILLNSTGELLDNDVNANQRANLTYNFLKNTYYVIGINGSSGNCDFYYEDPNPDLPWNTETVTWQTAFDSASWVTNSFSHFVNLTTYQELPAAPGTNGTSDYINVITRTPSDITIETPFNFYNISMTYEYFNTSNITADSEVMNYTVLSDVSTCVEFDNGTCEIQNNSEQTINATFIEENGNNSRNVTYYLNENQYAPHTENFNILQAGNSHENITLSSAAADDYYFDYIQNFTEGTGNYTIMYEIAMVTSQDDLTRIYVANSSYVEGSNPVDDANVEEVCNFLNATSYNHTHALADISHNICRIDVVDGFIGDVRVTNTLAFATRPIN